MVNIEEERSFERRLWKESSMKALRSLKAFAEQVNDATHAIGFEINRRARGQV